MAEEMVLRIVLEGIDNASDDVDRTRGSVDKLGSSFTETEKKGAMLLLAVNGLASGLNQMSGGMRKTADAGERMGLVSEQNAETIRGWSDTLEVIAGPMEIVSGIVNTLGSFYLVKLLFQGATVGGMFRALAAAAGTVVAALGSTVSIVIIFIAALVLFSYYVMVHREELQRLSHEYQDYVRNLESVKKAYDAATDAVNGFTNAIKNPGQTMTNIRDNIGDEVHGYAQGLTSYGSKLERGNRAF